jgi:hypothetical protein
MCIGSMNTESLFFIAVSALLFTTPGFTILFITQLWRDWPTLQRWIVAVGISIAIYPVLFYLARGILPNLHIGAHKLWVLIILCGITTFIYFWKERQTIFRLDSLELVAIGIITLTVMTRFWAVANQPYPAWSDALHHVLLTQLTAQNGQLPYTLQPYAPTSLDMYHLGLYSLTGSMEILTKLPAHTAFLWVSQLLNGLCGLGVYLFLDRKVGRKGALIGLIAIGLWSFQPAWYVNWSRTTSLAANTILLIAVIIMWSAFDQCLAGNKTSQFAFVSSLLIPGLMIASVFLLHFRIAGYFLPLLFIISLYCLVQSVKVNQTKKILLCLFIVAGIALILISPVIKRAIPVYINLKSTVTITDSDFGSYLMPLEGFSQVGVQNWLYIFTICVTIVGLLLHNKTLWLVLAWIILLGLEAYSFALKIPVMTFTSISGVVAIIYLPISLLIGLGMGEILNWLDERNKPDVSQIVLLGLLLSGCFFIPDRINGSEPFRYFMTDADYKAMQWVNNNIPADATFAINTYMWKGDSPHGVDGGYWIPYFTGRNTTASTMLFSLGSKENVARVVYESQLALSLESADQNVSALCAAGIHYLYSGEIGNIFSKGFNIELLRNTKGVETLYHFNNVYILKICSDE